MAHGCGSRRHVPFEVWALLLNTVSRVNSISSEMNAVLGQHNIYRCMHGVPLFTWDDDIAANAQSWANNGKFEHSTNDARTINGEACGENLAWGYPQRSGVDSTDAWYNEIQFTSPLGLATSMSDAKEGEAIGHYTQVVWKSSVKLGCGKGKATVNGKEGDLWVCQYGPAGNYVGQFSTEVTAPTKDKSSCDNKNSNNPEDSKSEFPSSCAPSPLVPVGGTCVYGYQCASKFCCPRLRLCVVDSSTTFSTREINVKPDMKQTVVDLVGGDGTCKDSFSQSNACMQTNEGKPLSTWDQTKCGCKAEYMSMYNAGTWVTLNVGVTCKSGSDSGQASAASVSRRGGLQAVATSLTGLLVACFYLPDS
eukprot:TRINITY_DN51037_c0_g1_i1.p1 TRINITY_DN51037_c0_g1~~TRINITY_DN51037_c0_g1_i1.p1  ORF type:complete len:364 (-),score=44.28 TRINITY_DN51037_c0_g1_i1:443-1534(-)